MHNHIHTYAHPHTHITASIHTHKHTHIHTHKHTLEAGMREEEEEEEGLEQTLPYMAEDGYIRGDCTRGGMSGHEAREANEASWS